jgi:CheY-like chemotaxis protein
VPTARVAGASDVAQILTNLALNALAWTPSGGEVAIEVEVTDATVTVSVQDAGPGVEPERAARIFEGDSTRPGGVGIGLRHARAVARAAGGEVELERTTKKGARFRFVWPRADATVATPLSNPRVPILAGRRVLVVEDDADVATLLETALGARGAKVTIARSATELAGAMKEAHDAALIDLSPIAHDVEGAIATLRSASPDVRLVFISGTAVGLPEALSGEDVSWVRKPFEVGEIVAALTAERGSKGA